MVSVVGVFTRMELLLTFYCWLIEMIFVICLFYAVNYVSGNASAKTKDPNTRFPDTMLNHVFSQSHLYAQVLTTASIALSSRKKWTELKSSWTLMMFFILPFGIQILFSPFNQSSEVIYGICLVFLCCLTLFVLYEAFKVMLRGLELLKETLESCRLMIENFGWITFMMHHWDRASVTKVMLISWWAKFVYILSTRYGFSWFSIFASFGDCCNSAISLLAASIVVAEMSKCVLELVRKSLQGQGPEQNEDEILNGGWNEGVSFFLLGFQTDIISAKSEERSLIISLIIFVTSSLLIQSAFEMVEPVLVSLGATYTGSINWRHMRALAMSILILIIPSYLIYTICITFEFDSWLFIIISSNVVTLVQMIGALTVYGLFIMNAHSESSWENLDDYVYYINAICKVFEFFMAVVVVLYSGWATVTGEWDLVGEYNYIELFLLNMKYNICKWRLFHFSGTSNLWFNSVST